MTRFSQARTHPSRTAGFIPAGTLEISMSNVGITFPTPGFAIRRNRSASARASSVLLVGDATWYIPIVTPASCALVRLVLNFGSV